MECELGGVHIEDNEVRFRYISHFIPEDGDSIFL
jgi:hypothetical protein